MHIYLNSDKRKLSSNKHQNMEKMRRLSSTHDAKRHVMTTKLQICHKNQKIKYIGGVSEFPIIWLCCGNGVVRFIERFGIPHAFQGLPRSGSPIVGNL